MMEFSLNTYRKLQSENGFFFPKNFLPRNLIDKGRYRALEKEHDESGLKISETFQALRMRTGTKYYQKIYPAQSLSLNFSESIFPAYRFIMPEVLADDWLAIVDFHKKHSRDHALHQPLTAYIVFCLLGGGISNRSLQINGKPLLDLCVDQILDSPHTSYLRDFLHALNLKPELLVDGKFLHKEVWKSLFYETAMVSAVFHDMGYPWQYVNRLNNSIKASDFNLKQLPSNARHIRDTFRDRLIMYPFYGYKAPTNSVPCNWDEKIFALICDSLSKTHGFPGALGFLYLNDLVREYPPSKDLSLQNFCIEWASLGIMMHDMRDIYWGNEKNLQPENSFLRLSFEKDPLSCIIALADILQDFERPMVKFDVQEDGSMFNYDSSCQSTSISVDTDTINIKYNFRSDNYRIINARYKIEEEKKYFDPKYGYVDLSSIGIKRIKLSCDY